MLGPPERVYDPPSHLASVHAYGSLHPEKIIEV